jgi:hypothetical protein
MTGEAMARRRKAREVPTATAGAKAGGLGRRGLLRLGGMAAVGAVGATAAGVAGAGSAAAADGDAMVLGRMNDSGIKDTRVTARSSKSALSVTNTSSGAAVAAIGRPIVAGGAVAAAGNGRALEVQGLAVFSRSGVFDLTTPGSSVVEIPVPGGVKATSHVLATLQNRTTTTGNLVQQIVAAEPVPATGKVKIHLVGNPNLGPGASVKIAWFVFD